MLVLVYLLSLSRVCGGDPRNIERRSEIESVFPAYAGVILIDSSLSSISLSLSRVCGGDPDKGTVVFSNEESFPRMRG